MDVTGLIIRSVDYGEADKILTLATGEGLLTVRVKGVRKASARLKSVTGLLVFGEFSLSQGKNGYILSGVSAKEQFLNCWTDAVRYASALLCTEIYEKCLSAGEELSFSELVKTLADINYGEVYPLATALQYGVKVASECGIDVTEGVFPENVSAVFSALTKVSDPIGCLADCSEREIKNLIKHLEAGFRSELGLKLTVSGKIFNMD